jgi:hypothetical protein
MGQCPQVTEGHPLFVQTVSRYWTTRCAASSSIGPIKTRNISPTIQAWQQSQLSERLFRAPRSPLPTRNPHRRKRDSSRHNWGGTAMLPRIMLFGLLLTFSQAALAMGCPMGSFPWVDNWGNAICKRFSDGSAAVTQTAPGSSCPTGSFPSVDSWGNSMCKSFNGGTNYYDTSRGCPIGTMPWTDSWGNPVCRQM